MKAWLGTADVDVLSASAILDRAMPSYDPVGFHAQQAAEKALKAFLVRHGVRFGNTHDIGALLGLAEAAAAGISERLVDARELTPYAVNARYPSDDPPLTREEASELLKMAQRVIADVRVLLHAYLQSGISGG